ncbi:MAG: DUF1844 domain-containing protein [Desulfobacterales bacterium]|nr:DUF1844 domain-containing protein [Desulfobacterales bacterium]MDX2511899.1 DUF1844 domain-containing protein [Desulfobacterales bacterium]
MSDEKKDFVVKDKRVFSQDAQESETKEETEAVPDVDEEKTEESEQATANEDYPLPEINFPTFIFSLNSSALVNLGVMEDPASNQKAKNLPMAKQTIDILAMMEEKTQGNLSDDEANMLKTMLYELRMLYVKESQ